jgi:membrane protein YqaA with SNARE-associated domain
LGLTLSGVRKLPGLPESMFNLHLIAAAAPTVARSFRRWIFHLGALGFIPLGLIDSSVIPVPGSMDVLTIVLAARDPKLWPYYAVMATVGSVLGALVTYRLARKGGEKALEKRLSLKRQKKVFKIFERWGFSAIAIPAMLPPPIPLVPFVLAAGAMQYSVKKFLLAITIGRIVRYSILGYLASKYGRKMLPFLTAHIYWVLGITMGLTAIAVVGYFLFGRNDEKKKTKR